MTQEKKSVYSYKKELYKYKRRLHRQKRRWRIEKMKAKRLFSPVREAIGVFISLILILVVSVTAINAIVIGTTIGDIGDISASDGYEVAVVFGAKVHDGGSLSHMLQDRMDTAIALYRKGAIKTLLLSGDGSGEWSEVKYMRLYAIEKGVLPEDIIEDGKGYSTIETVERTKKIFSIEKCVLVTQSYHLYRAIYAAESIGMDVKGASADVRTYYGQLYRDIREILARVKDFSLCIIK